MILDEFQFLAAVNALFPFIAFHLNNNNRLTVTGGIDGLVNLKDCTRDTGIDRSRHETASLGQQRAYLHFITLGHDRLRGCTDML